MNGFNCDSNWIFRSSLFSLSHISYVYYFSLVVLITILIKLSSPLTIKWWKILTQEDWNVVLFNGMERTTHWAALYFVVLMTFGNYVLFNLLVAILVEGFSQEVRIIIELINMKQRKTETKWTNYK